MVFRYLTLNVVFFLQGLALEVSMQGVTKSWDGQDHAWTQLMPVFPIPGLKTVCQYGIWAPENKTLRVFLVADTHAADDSMHSWHQTEGFLRSMQQGLSKAFSAPAESCDVSVLHGASRLWTLSAIARERLHHYHRFAIGCSLEFGDVIPTPSFELLMLWLGPFTSTNLEHLRQLDEDVKANRVPSLQDFKQKLKQPPQGPGYQELACIKMDHMFPFFVNTFTNRGTTVDPLQPCAFTTWTFRAGLNSVDEPFAGNIRLALITLFVKTGFMSKLKMMHMVPDGAGGFVLLIMLQYAMTKRQISNVIAKPFKTAMRDCHDQTAFLMDLMPVSPNHLSFQVQFFASSLLLPGEEARFTRFHGSYLHLMTECANRLPYSTEEIVKSSDWFSTPCSILFHKKDKMDMTKAVDFSMIMISKNILISDFLIPREQHLGNLPRMRRRESDDKTYAARANVVRIFSNLENFVCERSNHLDSRRSTRLTQTQGGATTSEEEGAQLLLNFSTGVIARAGEDGTQTAAHASDTMLPSFGSVRTGTKRAASANPCDGFLSSASDKEIFRHLTQALREEGQAAGAAQATPTLPCIASIMGDAGAARSSGRATEQRVNPRGGISVASLTLSHETSASLPAMTLDVSISASRAGHRIRMEALTSDTSGAGAAGDGEAFPRSVKARTEPSTGREEILMTSNAPVFPPSTEQDPPQYPVVMAPPTGLEMYGMIRPHAVMDVECVLLEHRDVHEVLLDFGKPEFQNAEVLTQLMIEKGSSLEFKGHIQDIYKRNKNTSDPFKIEFHPTFQLGINNDYLAKLTELKLGAVATSETLRVGSNFLSKLTRNMSVRDRAGGRSRPADKVKAVSQGVSRWATALYLIEDRIHKLENEIWAKTYSPEKLATHHARLSTRPQKP